MSIISSHFHYISTKKKKKNVCRKTWVSWAESAAASCATTIMFCWFHNNSWKLGASATLEGHLSVVLSVHRPFMKGQRSLWAGGLYTQLFSWGLSPPKYHQLWSALHVIFWDMSSLHIKCSNFWCEDIMYYDSGGSHTKQIPQKELQRTMYEGDLF